MRGLQPSNATDTALIAALYQRLLACWNERDAGGYAALFESEASIVGFDGSQMNGAEEVESTLRQIFDDHLTAVYVGKVREIRFLAPEVGLLRAVAGMVMRGESDLNPAVNTIQTLVAVKQDGQWCIALFQNTPAQFHGRPDLAAALTDELRQLL